MLGGHDVDIVNTDHCASGRTGQIFRCRLAAPGAKKIAARVAGAQHLFRPGNPALDGIENCENSKAIVQKADCVTIVAVTGASGAVGQAIVPQLVDYGVQPVLFGRDKAALAAIFPSLPVYQNEEIPAKLQECDVILHLATLNNNADCTDAAFQSVNVDWPINLASQARAAGISRFIYLSSTHALEIGNNSPYASSKRELALALADIDGINKTEIVAPKIYDDRKASLMRRAWQLAGAIKPTAGTSKLSQIIVEEIAGLPGNRTRLISKETPRPGLYYAFSTVVDVAFAVAVITLLGWLLIMVALAIRLESRGPALFRQQRVGRDGKMFICWKFRTMHAGSAHRATHEMSIASITRIGGFLRKTKLDELPQVVNLLRRELSLVGPRPCLPVQTELVDERQTRGVLKIRPGITGYAQINDVDMSDPKRLAVWDERYLALRSILFDVKILVATFVGGGRGDRVG